MAVVRWMSWIVTLGVAVMLLPVGVLAQAYETPTPARLSAEEMAAVSAGEFVIRTRRGQLNRGEVIGVVDAPIAQVWEVILDFDRYASWMDQLEVTRTLRHEGDVRICEGITRVPFPIRNRYWHVRVEGGARMVGGQTHYVGTWSYIPGTGNVEDTFGYWYVTPMPDAPERTLVKYVLLADLGIWVPNAILAWGTRRLLPSVMGGLRDEVARRFRS